MSRPRVDLIMPMAGRGSRFAAIGETAPKPLIELDGEPFFWWAAESVRSRMDVRAAVFVVLAEHVADHAIDRAILARCPDARIVTLPEVTEGALATALAGCDHLPEPGGWVIVNDCDHAFDARALAAALDGPAADAAGLLCHFRSSSPAYSYASYGEDGRLVRTAEKQPISPLAIAGAYAFRDAATLRRHARAYAQGNPYPELFVSGVYNAMAAAGETVRGAVLDAHVSFGTPQERKAALPGLRGLGLPRPGGRPA